MVSITASLNSFRGRPWEQAVEEVPVDDVQTQVTECIEGRQWEKFLELVSSNKGVVANGCETNLLHALCAHRPPNHVIEALVRDNPALASDTDALRRTPLHVAIGCGASSGVIRRLLLSNSSAAEARDSHGRTPLALACEEIGREKFALAEHEKVRVHRLTKAIKMLAQASPQSAAIEDEDEVTALEHAIYSDAPVEIIKVLQKVTASAVKQIHTTEKRRRSMDMMVSRSSSRSRLMSNDEQQTLFPSANDTQGTSSKQRDASVSAAIMSGRGIHSEIRVSAFSAVRQRSALPPRK